MSYTISILRCAAKELEKISDSDYSAIKKTITSLSLNPRPHGCKKLSGRDAWRVRVGNYRIIYEIHDKILTVIIIHLGHRKDVYR